PRHLAQRGELIGGVGLGVILRRALADPFKELALARDRDAVGFRLRQAVRRPAVIQQGPAELTDDEDVGILGDPFAGTAAAFAHESEGIGSLHGREAPGECDDALERGATRYGLFGQRAAFLFCPPAARRSFVLAAAGFFLVSEPMLARSASI